MSVKINISTKPEKKKLLFSELEIGDYFYFQETCKCGKHVPKLNENNLMLKTNDNSILKVKSKYLIHNKDISNWKVLLADITITVNIQL